MTASFESVLKFVKPRNYSIDVSLMSLKDQIEHWTRKIKGCKLDMDPEFQRVHVWTKEQQIAFVEFLIKGGISGRDILFNCQKWGSGESRDFVLVDGKQRLTACLAFMNGEIPVFGHYLNEYKDKTVLKRICLKFYVNDLPTMKHVLNWYLDMNAGGTPHTKEELDKVKNMLNKM